MALSNKDMYLSEYVSIINIAFDSNKPAKLDIKGSSMLPTLVEGDFVLLVPPTNLRKGDIVLYPTSSNTFALHRIVKLGTTLQVIGDNNVTREYINPSTVIAKVQYICTSSNKYSVFSCKYRLKYLFVTIRRFFRRVINKLKQWLN